MGNRIDELKGKTKETLGDLTGNEQMEREGEAEADRAKFEREAEGAVDQTVGGVQEKIGDITDDEKMEREGQARKVEGDIKRAG
jgi:uncharacterized protein YjbJ (UPF0337 family)